MKPRAVIFDLDDTLIDIYRAPEIVWRRVVDEERDALPVADPEPLLGLIEKHRAELWGTPERHREWRTDLRGTRREVVIRAFAELAFADEALAVRIADRFTDIREEEAQPVEGGLETVTGFRDAGVRTALMTNGEAAVQRAKIERFGLDALFDHVQIEGEAGVGKPEPAAFEMLLTAVEIEAREIWMVGDNLDWDVGAPQRHELLKLAEI